MNATKKSFRGPGGLLVSLDRSQVFPKDPGMGTPAMVYLPFGKGSATYYCAADTGEVEDEPLTPRQGQWLNDIADEVYAFLKVETP